MTNIVNKQVYSAAWGGEVAEPSTVSTIDDGTLARPERVELARKFWPEARAEDFERINRRRWRDKATGTVFRVVDGCGPLMQPRVEAVDLWFVHGGRIVMLVNDSRVEGSTVIHGAVRGGRVEDGQVVWTS